MRVGQYDVPITNPDKLFFPGENERLNGTYVHCTCSGVNPSCFATAYATADS